jgi:hypothetical protein
MSKFDTSTKLSRKIIADHWNFLCEINEKYGPKKCNVCDASYDSKNRLFKHLTEFPLHRSKKDGVLFKYVCDKCGYDEWSNRSVSYYEHSLFKNNEYIICGTMKKIAAKVDVSNIRPEHIVNLGNEISI